MSYCMERYSRVCFSMVPEILIIRWLHRMLLEATSCTSGRRCFGKRDYHNQICACSELQGVPLTCPSEISAISPYPSDRGFFYVQRQECDPDGSGAWQRKYPPLSPWNSDRLYFTDARLVINTGLTQSHEPDVFFACGSMEKTLFFLQIVAFGDNLEEKEDKVPLCRRRKGELTIPLRKSCNFFCHLVYGMEKRLPAAYVDQA